MRPMPKKLAPAQLRTLGPPRYATRGKLPVVRRDGEKGETPSTQALMPESRGIDAEQGVQPLFRNFFDFSVGYSTQAAASVETFFAISFLSLRTFGLSLSLLVFSSQLSRPPTCSTERRPCVETRSLTLCPRASEMSVTFCRFGRNVRFVLLLAWETLLPTCRPLPVSSQTRDMVSILIFVCGTWMRPESAAR